MGNEEYRYELREINDTDYNSFADVSFWYFTNGFSSSTSPAGHSDKRTFPPGTVVLCRLRKGTDDAGKQGYFMEGFAKVKKFSNNGRPVEFGESLSNRYLGGWIAPGQNQIIYDARAKGKVE